MAKKSLRIANSVPFVHKNNLQMYYQDRHSMTTHIWVILVTVYIATAADPFMISRLHHYPVLSMKRIFAAKIMHSQDLEYVKKLKRT